MVCSTRSTAMSHSSEIDHVKPHPEAFARPAELSASRPRRRLASGPMFEDVHGPQQVGMRAIWIPHWICLRHSGSR